MLTLRALRFTLFSLIISVGFTDADVNVRSRGEDSMQIEDVKSLQAALQAVHVIHNRNAELSSNILLLAARQGSTGNDVNSASDAPSATSSAPETSSQTSSDESATSTQATATETTPSPTPTQPSSSSSSESSSSSSSDSSPTATPTPDTKSSDSSSSSTSQAPSPPTAPADSPTSTPPSPTPADPPRDTITPNPSTFIMSAVPRPVSMTSTFTSTLPGGAVTTVTAITVITPTATAEDVTSTINAIGNLQTGSPGSTLRLPGLEVLAAGVLIGGAMLA